MWNMWGTWSYTKTVIQKWLQWSHSKVNDQPNMHSMKHNNIGIYACPKHKHGAIQENKHKEKQTKQSFLVNSMSSPHWNMHLPYGISLPLQMCMRNRISPPKDVHKSHIEMTKYSGILSRVYFPPFCQE